MRATWFVVGTMLLVGILIASFSAREDEKSERRSSHKQLQENTQEEAKPSLGKPLRIKDTKATPSKHYDTKKSTDREIIKDTKSHDRAIADNSKQEIYAKSIKKQRNRSIQRMKYTDARKHWRKALNQAWKDAQENGDISRYNLLKNKEPNKSDYL